MKLLLDTHVLLWWLGDDMRLRAEARNAIAEPENIVFVSAATTWEIAIKTSLGKLTLPEGLEDQISKNAFTPLPITIAHTLAIAQLPPIHQDPFDRMLVSQALLEDMTLITHDQRIMKYDVEILTA